MLCEDTMLGTSHTRGVYIFISTILWDVGGKLKYCHFSKSLSYFSGSHS